MSAGLTGGSTLAEGSAPQPAVGRVEPADHRVEPVQLGVDHQGQVQVELAFVLLEPGPLLHQLDHVPAMDLDHLVDVDPRHPAGDQDLDDQLVARRRRWRGRAWRAQPLRAARSRPPSAVIRNAFCGPSSPLSSDSTRPSRSSRCRVVYTCPTFSGHTSPVRASNSWRSCRPYLGPSLSRASSAWRTLIGLHHPVAYSVYNSVSKNPRNTHPVALVLMTGALAVS